MHIKGTAKILFRHLPFGGNYTVFELSRQRLYCEHFIPFTRREIPFKAPGYQMTDSLFTNIEDLLSTGKFTVKLWLNLVGLNASHVASIDQTRLARLYYRPDRNGPVLKKPLPTLNVLANR